MLDTKLIDILPDEMSDETVHHLVNFMIELSLGLESRYLAQLRRYDGDGRHADL
jgi:hypothetical protein